MIAKVEEDWGGWAKWVKRVKRHKLSVMKYVNHRDVIYSLVTIVNNTVLQFSKLIKRKNTP